MCCTGARCGDARSRSVRRSRSWPCTRKALEEHKASAVSFPTHQVGGGTAPRLGTAPSSLPDVRTLIAPDGRRGPSWSSSVDRCSIGAAAAEGDQRQRQRPERRSPPVGGSGAASARAGQARAAGRRTWQRRHRRQHLLELGRAEGRRGGGVVAPRSVREAVSHADVVEMVSLVGIVDLVLDPTGGRTTRV